MADPNDYLWTGEGEADPFLAELERGLAPLDDAESLLEQLELEQLATREAELAAAREAELEVLAHHISLAPELEAEPGPQPTRSSANAGLASTATTPEPVQLRPLEASEPEAKPARLASWGWLAAAVAVLGLSVGVLMSERDARRSASERVEITGSSAATRVIIDAAPEHHAALRGAHAALSSCALGLEADDSQTFALRLYASEVELDAATPASTTATCVSSALTALELELAEPVPLRVELHGPSAR